MPVETYPIGTSVRVLALTIPGHVRTPTYVRGHTGTVERVLGPFENPEALAVCNLHPGAPAERLPLYRVRFRMADLWGNASPDLLETEIYSHWLEPADAT